LKGLPLLSYR